MGQYAQNTQVSADRSIGEIQSILRRYGATRFGYVEDDQEVRLAFEAHNRRIQFHVRAPDLDEFTKTPTGRRRKDTQVWAAWEQAYRQRYRALALVIKAKLEAVDSGITTFEEEFLAHIVLPNGATVGRTMLPQIEEAYETNKMPHLLAE